MAGFSFLLVFVLFILIGVPVSLTMGLATLTGMIAGGYSQALFVIVQQLAEGVQKHSLLAIPFFILAGNLMNETGITDRIFNFASKLVGHMRGGLAQVNVLASVIFAGISGAAVADAAGLGAIEIRAMTARGYDRAYSASVSLASSIIGPLIPPSIPFVIYAIVAQQSVARLFLAGVIPGLLTAVALMILNVYYARTKPDFPPPEPRASAREIIFSFKDGFWALLAPIIIVGGLTGGFFTATEAGVVAVLYSALVGLIYGGPKALARILPGVLRQSVETTVVLMFLMANATAMSWFLSRERIPSAIASAVAGFSDNPTVFLILVLIYYLILGTMMESLTGLLLSVPILLPIALQMGIDPIHFGVVTVYALLLGMGTPPVGVGLFVMVRVGKISFEEMVRAFMPFFIPLGIVLLIITFIPSSWQWLPNLIMGPR